MACLSKRMAEDDDVWRGGKPRASLANFLTCDEACQAKVRIHARGPSPCISGESLRSNSPGALPMQGNTGQSRMQTGEAYHPSTASALSTRAPQKSISTCKSSRVHSNSQKASSSPSLTWSQHTPSTPALHPRPLVGVCRATLPALRPPPACCLWTVSRQHLRVCSRGGLAPRRSNPGIPTQPLLKEN